jgi:hypothetical protein
MDAVENPLLEGSGTQERCRQCRMILFQGLCLDCGPVASTPAKAVKVSNGLQLPYIRPQSVEALVRSGEVTVSVGGRSGVGAAIWIDVQSMPFAGYYQQYFQSTPMPDGFYAQFWSAACESACQNTKVLGEAIADVQAGRAGTP